MAMVKVTNGDRVSGATTKEEIAARVKKLRESHGLTMVMLAKRIGVDIRTIARWEADGTTEENLEKVRSAVSADRKEREGRTPESGRVDLTRISTLDLALELASRARAMEERDRKVTELMDRMVNNGMEWMLPDDL